MANPNLQTRQSLTVDPGIDALQIFNTKGTIVSWIDSTGTGQGNLVSGAGGVSAASLSTAGQGYFLGPGCIFGLNNINTTTSTLLASTDSANNVRVFQFVLPFQITIGKVRWATGTTSAGATISFGIYSGDGTTLLLDSGTFDGSVPATTVLLNTISPRVTLSAGVYYFAWSSNNKTVAGSCMVNSSTGVVLADAAAGGSGTSWINQTIFRTGVAANNFSSGMPSSLGTISTAAALPPPVPIFEP